MQILTVQGLGKVYLARPPKLRLLGGLFGRAPARGRGARRQVHAGGIRALDDVTFAVSPGTILGIIGPNGAGKSTLLKILARVTPPTEGSVLGRGRVVSLLELGVGFQGDLSGRDNVFLSAAVYGVPRREIAGRLEAIAEFAGLADFMSVPVSRYSSGMYLRLAFAAAIHMDPDILLADEVLAVGDLEFQERCLERVRQERDRGRTILFVSHDLVAITRLCDQVLWLDGGRVRDHGDPRHVVARYRRATLAPADERGTGRALPAGDHVRIVDVDLVSEEGGEIGAVRADQTFFVRILFEVDGTAILVRPRIRLEADDVVVLQSEPARALQVDRPGLHDARVRIPRNLLAERDYLVTVTLPYERAGAIAILKARNVLTFRAFGDGIARHGLRAEAKSEAPVGVVAPRLKWSCGPVAPGGADAGDDASTPGSPA
jgi:ABC-type polysaccharide/polyol phosphate transport system ATPase subunit